MNVLRECVTCGCLELTSELLWYEEGSVSLNVNYNILDTVKNQGKNIYWRGDLLVLCDPYSISIQTHMFFISLELQQRY